MASLGIVTVPPLPPSDTEDDKCVTYIPSLPAMKILSLYVLAYVKHTKRGGIFIWIASEFGSFT